MLVQIVDREFDALQHVHSLPHTFYTSVDQIPTQGTCMFLSKEHISLARNQIRWNGIEAVPQSHWYVFLPFMQSNHMEMIEHKRNAVISFSRPIAL